MAQALPERRELSPLNEDDITVTDGVRFTKKVRFAKKTSAAAPATSDLDKGACGGFEVDAGVPVISSNKEVTENDDGRGGSARISTHCRPHATYQELLPPHTLDSLDVKIQ